MKFIKVSQREMKSPIHDRMPALLRPEEMAEFMAGSTHWDFQPFNEPLKVAPCESPLAKRPSSGLRQSDLF